MYMIKDQKPAHYLNILIVYINMLEYVQIIIA